MKVRIDGLVLAGGRSRRFGSDKRLVEIGGETLVARAVRKVRAVVDGVVFVATGPAREHLRGTRRAIVIRDEPPGRGPLGGIAAALERARAGVLVLACDLPDVRTATLARVAATGRACGRPAAVRTRRGWEPLVSYWPRATYTEVRAALGAGLSAPHALLERLGAAAVEGVDLRELRNVNRPGDLAAPGEQVRR